MSQLAIPGYAAPIIVVVSLTLAAWLYRLVAIGTESAGASHGARIRGLTALFLAAWLGLAFFAASTSPVVDPTGRGVIPPTFLFFGGISLALAIGLLALSPTWRRVVDAIPADALISAQVYRVIGGLLFLPLYGRGILPAYFAKPAGWGDLAVGALALLVAFAVRQQVGGSRAAALLWNFFGVLDLLIAVGLGTGKLVPLLAPGLGSVSPVAAMTYFPLVLIPTFAVPVGFILHLYSIRRVLREGRLRQGRETRGSEPRMAAAR